MIFNDEQVNEFLQSIKEEHDNYIKELMKISIYSDKRIKLDEIFQMSIPERKIVLEVIKEYNEARNKAQSQ